MADVKVPKLLHKMSVSAQKAWYKKHGMEMPSSEEGKSAAQAKKVKIIKKVAAPVKPQSVRDINAARQKAYYEKGGRAPIGAGGSGGHSSMAGVDQSTIRGIKAGIKAGINPKVALVRYTEEVSKKEAEAVIGGPIKEKPKMPPGKQPAGYRYVRGLARKAMKAGLKKEEVGRISEMDSEGYRGHRGDEDPGKGSAKYVKPVTAKKTQDDAAKVLAKSFEKDKLKKEEVELDEVKKPDASMAMTHQLKMKMISDKDKRTLGKVADLMAAQKKKDKPVKEETEESTMQYIEEKLTAADPASKWISDFVKSDNPKFAGKSKKERIQQALGAYYAMKREEFEIEESKKMDKMEKEVEQTDEAAEDWKKAFSNVAQKNLKKDIGKIKSKVGRLNYIGMQPAVDATPKVTAAVTKKGSYSEEVEQVDEVTGYEGVKNRTDMIKRAAAMNRMGKQTFLDRVKARAAEIKREKAKKELAKEEVEQIDEVKTANPGRGYHGEHPADKADAKYAEMHAKLLKTAVAGNSSSKKIRNYLDSTHGRHLAGHENDSEYIAKDFAKFDRSYKPEMFKEEQIDELKKSTLASYVKKATRDVASASRLQRGYETDAIRSEFPPVQRGSELAAKNMRKFAGKRSRGIARAVDKLAKEEVEGKDPETSTEVALAKKHGNPKKITYGDVIKARIETSKKKAVKGE